MVLSVRLLPELSLDRYQIRVNFKNKQLTINNIMFP
jgi:hypothetical protein